MTTNSVSKIFFSALTITPAQQRYHVLIGKRESDTCRDYEYSVEKTCLLNYCSSSVPCYAGRCDLKRNVCTNATDPSAARLPLPVNNNPIISLGDDPFGTRKEGISPVLIIIMAAGAVVAIAVIGCIVRTILQWTKSSVAWASDSHRSSSSDLNGDEKAERGMGDNKRKPSVKEVSNASSNQSDSSIMRKPSKFTGSHYMPEPAIQSSPLDEISPFGTPISSPHFSPYSHPDHSQGSDMSLSNPFRHRINDSRISMDLLSSNGSPANTNGQKLSEMSSSPDFGKVTNVEGPTPAAPAPTTGPEAGVSRSQTLSPRPAPPASSSSNLSLAEPSPQIRSAPLPFVGPRSPPPPPTMYSERISSPLMTYSQNNRKSTATVLTPSMSLDSLMDYSNNNHQHTSVVVNDFSPSSRPSSPPLRPSSSLGSPLVIQSGAERHPSLTVPHRQSMLRHSASVPQLVNPSATPAQRNLPAGFASSPITMPVHRP
ncbi:hypothetical protein FBU30_003107 [Linnemannia zychae]|nr:hypothetical protein FBU30_003107 [Linnemannia zychae]